MGYLVFKSGFLPRIVGSLLMIGCIGYLVDPLMAFLWPDLGVSVAQFTFIGEVLLPLVGHQGGRRRRVTPVSAESGPPCRRLTKQNRRNRAHLG